MVKSNYPGSPAFLLAAPSFQQPLTSSESDSGIRLFLSQSNVIRINVKLNEKRKKKKSSLQEFLSCSMKLNIFPSFAPASLKIYSPKTVKQQISGLRLLIKLYLKFGGQCRELWSYRLTLLDLRRGNIYSKRSTYKPIKRILLCHSGLLFCSICCHITSPGQGLPQAYTRQPILLLLAPTRVLFVSY